MSLSVNVCQEKMLKNIFLFPLLHSHTHDHLLHMACVKGQLEPINEVESKHKHIAQD